jgi:hypothetical protein
VTKESHVNPEPQRPPTRNTPVMAWRAVTLLALAALAVPATSAAPSATWPASSTQPGPLLGIVFESTGWRLARIDPGSLEAMAGPSIVVGRSSGSWAFSPDRALLAVATETLVGRRIVRILDPASLRQRTAVRLTGYLGPVAWPAPDRVLAISDCCAYSPNKIEVVSYDPLARRIVRRATVDGRRLRTVRAPDGFVLLVGPEEGFGPARIVVADANGALRSTTLDVVAGYTQPDGEPYVFRQRLPGLAVDPEGGRAFVVTPESHVVEIDLATLAVREHDLSRRPSRSSAGYTTGSSRPPTPRPPKGRCARRAGSETACSPFRAATVTRP